MAVNTAVHDKPAKEKLKFSEIPFYPHLFYRDRVPDRPGRILPEHHCQYALGLGGHRRLILGKWIAAQTVGRAFAYSPVARLTVWSLTLPQVAATLAAALVAFDTRNAAHQGLLDTRLLNVVLVLLLTTSILGPVLTEHFAPRLLKDAMPPDRMKADGTP